MRGASFNAICGCEGDGTIEPSLYVLNIDGENLVLDAGHMEGMDISLAVDSLRKLNPRPRAILISHAHLDHIGLLPIVHEALPYTPIVMTPLTRSLAKIGLEDAVQLSPSLEEKILELSDTKKSFAVVLSAIHETLDFAARYETDLDKSIRFGGLTIYLRRAGHVPGAASFLIQGGQKTTVLYTGDFSLTDFLTVPAAALPKGKGYLDLLITEATYGNCCRGSRAEEINKFVTDVGNVLKRGGRVLIPSFALGRAQEILAILLKTMIDHKLDQYPIYLAGMAQEMTKAYDYHIYGGYVPVWTRKNIGKLTGSGEERGSWGIVELLDGNREKIELAITMKRPSIFVASSGMLNGGPSVKFARHILPEKESAVFFVGFLDEESPGKELSRLGKGGRYRDVRVLCDIYNYKLSAHSDQRELVEFANAWNPRHIILVHGPYQRVKEELGALLEKPGCEIHIPSNGESVVVSPSAHVSQRLYREERALLKPYEFEERLETTEPMKPFMRVGLSDVAQLLGSLLKCLYDEIDERIPFGLFCRAASGDEYARYEMLWKHGYSLLIDRDQNPEFSVSETHRDRLLQRISDLIYEKLVPVVSRDAWDHAAAPVHPKEIPGLLLRRTPSGDLRVTLNDLLSRVDPNWKRFALEKSKEEPTDERIVKPTPVRREPMTPKETESQISRSPIERVEAIVVKDSPKTEQCQHHFITTYSQYDMHGDIRSVVRMCTKCGYTERTHTG